MNPSENLILFTILLDVPLHGDSALRPVPRTGCGYWTRVCIVELFNMLLSKQLTIPCIIFSDSNLLISIFSISLLINECDSNF